jgi:membrane protein implicated in regulation of membrane protease activity
MPAPWLLALALVIGLLILVPARRLQLAGLAARTIGLYALTLWLLAMIVAIQPVATRVLVPILLISYIAPFVAAPDTVRRVLRQGDRPGSGRSSRGPQVRPPMKNVTPPEAGFPVDAPDDERP